MSRQLSHYVNDKYVIANYVTGDYVFPNNVIGNYDSSFMSLQTMPLPFS